MLLVALSCLHAALASEAQRIADISAGIDAGQFIASEAEIKIALARPGLDGDERDALAFERERMRRILLDFTLTAADVKATLRKQIPDLADAEFIGWDARGLFERQVIDGRVWYFNRSVSNLFRLSPEARARRKLQTAPVDNPMESANAHHREVRQAALLQHTSSVAPRHLRVTQTLVTNADTVPAGETVRAWIPYPRALPGQQEDIRFIRSVPAKHLVAPESTLQRTVYLEAPAQAGKPTVFSITYELMVFGRYHVLDADNVVPAKTTPELAPFVAERAPHIVFTESVRLLSRQVVGDETNPPSSATSGSR